MSDNRKRVAQRTSRIPGEPAPDVATGPVSAQESTAVVDVPPGKQPSVPPAFWNGIPQDPTGVRVIGTIIGRNRTNLPTDVKTGIVRQKVTYRIATDKVDLMVDDFQPPEYLPIGIYIDLPVQVRAYIRRGNGAGYGLTINRPSSQGEEF